jgi:hypothetical protein
MRPIHLLLGLAVVLASAASAYVTTRMVATTEQGRPEVVSAHDNSNAPSDPLAARVAEDKFAYLAARVDALSLELEALRSTANRAPVATPMAVVAPDEVATSSVTAVQRETVLAVLAETRAREAAEAQAKKDADDRQQAERRAARIAKDLTLSPGDETRLAGLMYDSGKKRQEMFESMRNGNFDRELARTQFETLRTWQTDQYNAAFGASVAEQILAAEGDRGGFGGGFGGGQGGGQAGGQNGATRGQRRGGQGGGTAGGTQQN